MMERKKWVRWNQSRKIKKPEGIELATPPHENLFATETTTPSRLQTYTSSKSLWPYTPQEVCRIQCSAICVQNLKCSIKQAKEKHSVFIFHQNKNNPQIQSSKAKKEHAVYHIYQPLCSGRMWHKVNFLSGV